MFTVRKGIGEKLITQLPSVVGIQRPKTTVTNPQTFSIPNTPATLVAEQAKRDSIYKVEKAQYDALHPSVWTGKGWALSPNPAAWHNGNYNVSVRSGSLKQVRRFVVMH